MSTVAGLKAEIRRLRSDIDWLNNEQNKLRNQLREASNIKIKELESQYKDLLRKKTAENEAVYAQRLHNIEVQMLNEYQDNIRKIREADEAASLEREIYLKQLKESNEELRREIEHIEEEEENRKHTSLYFAKKSLEEADVVQKNVEMEPHEFFFPEQLDIILEHLEKTQLFINNEMYGAAASMAEAAIVELELLEIKTRQKRHEWELLYQIYKELVERIHQKLTEFKEEELITRAGRFKLSDKERTFWSREHFDSIESQINQAYDIVQNIEIIGINQYLKSGKAEKEYHFTRNIQNIRNLEDCLVAVITCIRNERIFSDERFVFGQAVAEMYSGRGYTILKDEYKHDAYDKENPMDSYEVEVSINGIDKMRISLVPRRENGVVISNECLVSEEVKTIYDDKLVRNTNQECKELIKENICKELVIETFQDSYINMKNRENLVKRVPEPEKLMRKLERKYQ